MCECVSVEEEDGGGCIVECRAGWSGVKWDDVGKRGFSVQCGCELYRQIKDVYVSLLMEACWLHWGPPPTWEWKRWEEGLKGDGNQLTYLFYINRTFSLMVGVHRLALQDQDTNERNWRIRENQQMRKWINKWQKSKRKVVTFKKHWTELNFQGQELATTYTEMCRNAGTCQRAVRQEHCRLCTVALIHFRTVNVCLLYEGTLGEKRNSSWCLFELSPNPKGGCIGGLRPPNPSRSCTPCQPHTHVL